MKGHPMQLPCLRLMILIAAPCVTACTPLVPVQPWDKGNLAKPEMAIEGDPLDVAFMEHTYFSKEASSGGTGVGGGGCGCN